MRTAIVTGAVVLFVLGWAVLGDEGQSALFPFVLPWDDAGPSVANLSGWLSKPAGKSGHIRVGEDGHLCVGRDRIRLLGVDLSFSANIPRHEDAEKIVPRMAKFGINIVRFHIMDLRPFPEGILARDAKGTRDLDPEAMDRLDYFTAQLKANGIYTYVCLLNYRSINAADGLPDAIEHLGGTVQRRHVVGFFDERVIELQREYARKLLTHRNAYTNTTYAEDPAVAFVEINNENGLIHAWLGGDVDALPEVFLSVLRRQWNEWLVKRYGGTDGVRRAWGVKEEAPGQEMLANTDFARGMESWMLERHAGAEAVATPSDDVPDPLRGTKSICIDVTKIGTADWHIRFEQTGIRADAERPYTVTFWAKADKPATVRVGLEQAHTPYKGLGFQAKVNLTAQWQPFRFVPLLSEGDANARLIFDPPMQTGRYSLAGVSLRPGGVVGLPKEERVEDGTVSLFLLSRSGEHTLEAQRDWLRFLWETEDRYWQEMCRYLKDDLGVKSLVIGTSTGCSTPNLMAKMDCVDAHAYWCHPIFPGRPWDPVNWIVQNRTMVNERGGILPGIALRRVLGKPLSITEYGHCSPNTYVSEWDLLRGAYAALQDWDYISTSRYSHKDDWDLRRMRNFIDIDQHPTRMITLIPAAAMFLRGDVKPAEKQVVAAMDKEREIEALRRSRAWELAHAGQVGVPREAVLIHRVAIAVEGQSVPPGALRPEDVKVEGDRFASDTGELLWDVSQKDRGVVTVNAGKSKAVIGYGGGKRFDLGGVVIEPGPTLQDGWSAITMTAMNGDFASAPARILITATGYVENTKMGWKNAEKNTVGKDWGEAPTLVEGIPARITLPVSVQGVEAWALGERGERKASLTVAAADGKAVIAIGPDCRTLWYEIEVK